MNKIFIRRLFAAAACISSVLPFAAHARSYPAKPVRLVIGFLPGGAVNCIAKTLAGG